MALSIAIEISNYLKHSHSISKKLKKKKKKKNLILPSQELLYHLYHTILQHTHYPIFYFIIPLIKIIYTTQ